jgi:hypothetical protein
MEDSGFVEQFIRQGWVAVEGALSADYCEDRVQAGFDRIGADAARPETWPGGWHAIAPTEAPPFAEAAPLAGDVLRALIGPDTEAKFDGLPDNLIFNFPDERAWWPAERWDVPEAGYHKDGDWFRHFLDSPEQGLLGIVFWRDVAERQGPTYLATDSIGPVARFLASRPRGVDPGELPYRDLLSQCQQFVPLTGRQGTVVFAHPFLLHSASVNATNEPRVISNTSVILRNPLRFDRQGASSAVEQVIIDAVGPSATTFEAMGPRRGVESERTRRWQEERTGA